MSEIKSEDAFFPLVGVCEKHGKVSALHITTSANYPSWSASVDLCPICVHDYFVKLSKEFPGFALVD